MDSFEEEYLRKEWTLEEQKVQLKSIDLLR